MPMKSVTFKVEEEKSKALQMLARERRVPYSTLVRDGIDKVIQESRDSVITPELRKWVDASLTKNAALMRKLADL